MLLTFNHTTPKFVPSAYLTTLAIGLESSVNNKRLINNPNYYSKIGLYANYSGFNLNIEECEKIIPIQDDGETAIYLINLSKEKYEKLLEKNSQGYKYLAVFSNEAVWSSSIFNTYKHKYFSLNYCDNKLVFDSNNTLIELDNYKPDFI